MSERRPPVSVESLHRYLRGKSDVPARDLLKALDILPVTLSRFLAQDGGRTILRRGAARATRYTLLRDVRELGSRWPLFRILSDGTAHHLGDLLAGQGRDFFFPAADDAPNFLTAGSDIGRFDGLPWYLDDLRPSGYLGRLAARRWSKEFGVPADPRDFSADDQIEVMLRRGDDLAGDLCLGEEMVRLATAMSTIESVTPADYPAVVRRLTDHDEPVGSSAAGEQPKFSVYADIDDQPRWVIVKFADDRTENGRRMADLLIAEHVALEALRDRGIASATSRVRDIAGIRFFETDRFDRVAARGRRSMISLTAVDAQFGGVGRGWTAAVRRLLECGMISAEAARTAEIVDAFGAAIANTDRHNGNLSFRLADRGPAELCPIYDMLPMAFAAGVQGPRPYEKTSIAFPPDADPSVVECTTDWAREYWAALASDDRVSPEFRSLARTMAD